MALPPKGGNSGHRAPAPGNNPTKKLGCNHAPVEQQGDLTCPGAAIEPLPQVTPLTLDHNFVFFMGTRGGKLGIPLE